MPEGGQNPPKSRLVGLGILMHVNILKEGEGRLLHCPSVAAGRLLQLQYFR